MSGTAPPSLSLLPQQFYWDTSVTAAGKIWVGVPITVDPTGRKMVLDLGTSGSLYLPLSGGQMTGPIRATQTTAPLIVSADPALPAAYRINTVMQVVGARGGNARYVVDAYGGAPIYTGRSAQGSPDAPASAPADRILLGLSGLGRATTDWAASSSATINLTTAENFSDTAHGTYITFNTTPIGGVTIAERMRLTDQGALLVGLTAPTAPVKFQVIGGSLLDALTVQITQQTSPLFLNANATATAATGAPWPVAAAVHTIGADGLGAGYSVDAYGGAATFIGRMAGGTVAARTPPVINSSLLVLQARGFNGTAFTGNARAQIAFNAAAAWGAGDNSTYITFATTAIGTSTNPVERLRVTDAGALQFAGVTGPSISVGAGAPAGTAPAGSIYMRTDGAAGTRVYVNQNGATTWLPIAGV